MFSFHFLLTVGKRILGLEMSLVARQATLTCISSFSNMKRLGVFLLPPGQDASPSQGYPPALNLRPLVIINFI